MNLNKQQRIAVESSDKYLCVLAGPGTGKTHTITAKIIYLLEQGINPKNIAALTFTQKASLEMRQRVIKRLNKKELPFIGTFHLLCIRLLREFLPEKSRHFNLCTRKLQKEIISKIAGKNVEKIIERISRFKNKETSLDDKTLQIWENYEKKKKELNLLDFDDLLLKTSSMIKEGKIPPLFEHIIVDEFQDINKIQYEIIKGLLKKTGYLSVFGDPDQAIYSFRGSEVELFLNLPSDFKDLKLLNLSINYRSQANILLASNKFITANTKRFSKRIEPSKPSTSPIILMEVEDEFEEAKTILKEIKKRVGATNFTDLYTNKEETIYTFNSFAVLSRTNNGLKIIKEMLIKEGIPVKTIKKEAEAWIESFIKELTELLSKEEIVKKLIEPIPLYEFLESTGILKDFEDYEAYLIKNMALAYEKGILIEQIQAFIDELYGLTSLDLFPETLNAVSLLTLHSAKGLEFPVVFIGGFQEGIIPYTLSSEYDIEEERRLFYVGMTRAMNELIIVYARNRVINGKKVSLPVSSFLKEIPEEYVKYEKVRPLKGEPIQKKLF